MIMENYIGRELTEEELKTSPQTCVSQADITKALNQGNKHSVKDYNTYLIMTSTYMAMIAIVFAIFFRTQQKRSDVDNEVVESSAVGDIVKNSASKGQVMHLIL